MPEIDVPALTIFGQPGCVQCTAAERFAKTRNLPYQKIDVTESPEALNLIQTEWGYKSVPVLYYNGEHANGFNPNFLEQVHTAITAGAAA